MKRVDNYLLRHFLHFFGLTLGSCIGIFLLVDFLEKAGRFIDYKAGAEEYLSYVLNSIPVVFIQMVPLAILMSTVLTLGGLGRSNEMTALRACGLSLWRIARPIMLAVLVIALGFLLVNELLAPLNTRQLTRLLDYQLRGRPEPSLNSDRIWYRDGNRIINVALAQPAKQRLQGVTVFELGDNFLPQRRLEIPELSYAEESWQTATINTSSFDPVSGSLESSSRETGLSVDIGREPKDFVKAAEQRGLKSSLDLWQSINKLKDEGFDTTRLEVDLQSRLAAPFTCLAMAFLGIPFSLSRGRGSSLALGIGLSIGVGVGFFLLFSISLAFGYSGALPPLVSGWAANIIFLLIGTYLILRMRD